MLDEFLMLCDDNAIWFSVYPSGDIDEITFCDSGNSVYPKDECKIGTKDAVCWLLREIKLESESDNDS